MTSPFSIKNWPLAIKFIVPCLLLLALDIFNEANTYATVNKLSLNLHKIVSQNYNASMQLSNAVNQLRHADDTLHLMQVRAAAGMEVKAAEEAASIQKTIDGVTQNLNELAADANLSINKEDIAQINAKLKEYKDAVGFVGSMLDIDFKSTANFVVPLGASYDSIVDKLETTANGFLKQSNDDVASIVAETSLTKQNLVITSAVSFVTITIVVLLIVLLTVSSVNNLAKATQRLAEGRIDVDIETLKRKDELGHIVNALQVFRDNVVKMGSLKSDFEREVGSVVTDLVAAIDTMMGEADRLTNAATSMSQQATEATTLSNKTMKDAEYTKEVTRSLFTAIGQIASHVNSSAEMTKTVSSSVSGAQQKMDALSSVTDQINKVTTVISGIANKTKLLSLNATIEAARAGEMGKGFAVVASEVKTLASQTETATSEIANNVGLVQEEAKMAVTSFSQIRDMVEKLQEIAMIGSQVVEEQNATTGEINRAIEAAEKSTETICRILEQTKVEVEHTDAAAKTVTRGLYRINEKATQLRESVITFVRDMGSA